MYNSADESFDSSVKVNAVIEYTGQIKYLPPVMLKSTCSIAIAELYIVLIFKTKYFKWLLNLSPFDEQTCYLKFGSWTYDESKINLTALDKFIQTDTYSASGEWDLTRKKESNFILQLLNL